MVLRSVQISSSGEASHEVTASLGVSAYVPGDDISQAIADADSATTSDSPRNSMRTSVSSSATPEGRTVMPKVSRPIVYSILALVVGLGLVLLVQQ